MLDSYCLNNADLLKQFYFGMVCYNIMVLKIDLKLPPTRLDFLSLDSALY